MNRVQIILILAIIAFGIVYFYYQEKRVMDSSDKIEVHGSIEQLEYDEKGYPSVRINGVYYNMPFANNGQLAVGDSIAKRKGSHTIDQYRNDTIVNSFHGNVTFR